MPSFFIKLGRVDTNFTHLAESLLGVLGQASPITSFVRDNADGVRYLIDLRNFHEHPKKKRTILEGFRVLPNGQIQTPSWYLKGEGAVEVRPIREEMAAALDFIHDIAKGMFVHLLMYRISNNLPFYIQEVPEAEINSKLPIRYKLSIDITKTQMTK